MNISGYDIKPISLYLPDTPEWVERDAKAKEYFAANGIEDIQWVAGVHAFKWGIQGRHIYLLDERPHEQHYVGDKNVGCFLSSYVMYSMMSVMPHTHFFFLETDARFLEGWRAKLEQALLDVPPDFDFLFVGSCCAEDKSPVRIKGDVHYFPHQGRRKWFYYPQCGHAIIIAKKCVQHLIATQRDVANPIDTSLMRYAFPELKIYAILPRIVDQGDVYIPK